MKISKREYLKFLLAFWAFSANSSQANDGSQPASADWSSAGYDPANSGYNPGTVGPDSLELIWEFETEWAIRNSPIVSEGTVYFGSEDRHFYAVSAETGELYWKFELGESIEENSAAVSGEKVIVSAPRDQIYALNKDTGDLLWSEGIGLIRTRITIQNQTVLYTVPNRLFARDIESGEQLWSFSAYNGSHSAPAVSDESVYFGTTEEKLYSIDIHTGEEEWTFRPFDWITCTPAVADETVFIGSNDGYLYAIDSASGDEIWKNDEANSDDPPAIANGVAYTAGGGNLIALDANTGEEIWKVDSPGGIPRTQPSVAEGYVYYPLGSSLYIYDTDTGEQLSRYQTNERISYSSPAISGNGVFVGSEDNSLYGFSDSEIVFRNSEFEIAFTEIPEKVTEGEELVVEFEIHNVGDGTDSQDVIIRINEEVHDIIENVELEPSQTFSDQLSHSISADDFTEIDILIETNDDTISEIIPVLKKALFRVNIVDNPQTVTEGEVIEISFEITNVGDLESTQDIEIQKNGDFLKIIDDVNLEGGETIEESIAYETDSADIGELNFSVTSNDEESEMTVVVESIEESDNQTPTPTPESTPPPTQTPSPGDSTPTPTPTREDDSIPGFGWIAGLSGIGGIAYMLKRRLDTDEDKNE